jgi:hypothetical protein
MTDPARSDVRPPSPGPPHPVHTVTHPTVVDVSPHDPGAGHAPDHGVSRRAPDAALMHLRDPAHSAPERNKMAKAQGHTRGGAACPGGGGASGGG